MCGFMYFSIFKSFFFTTGCHVIMNLIVFFFFKCTLPSIIFEIKENCLVQEKSSLFSEKHNTKFKQNAGFKSSGCSHLNNPELNLIQNK